MMKNEMSQTFARDLSQLNAYLPHVREIDGVASAMVWVPDADYLDEFPDARPELQVEAYRSARNWNPSTVKCEVATPWLEQASDGSGQFGPCWSWVVKPNDRSGA